MSCPIVIEAVLIAIQNPLSSIGLTSDKYNGTIYAATPTPRPTNTRPSIRTPIVGAIPIITEPTVNKISANKMTFFLPILSEIKPEKSDPKAAPASAMETTNDCC